MTDDPATMLRRLWDMEQIRQTKARYCRLMDTKAWEEWRTLFTDDCVHALPQEVGDAPISNADYLDQVPAALDDSLSFHFGGMPEITFTSDTEAEVIWAMFDYVDHPERGTTTRGYGHYFETYRKGDDGGWRISSKRNVRLRLDEVPLAVD